MASGELPLRGWRRVAVAALAIAASGAVWPCGLEDPASVGMQRGFMNFAYPNSAYVRTAIWQAQMTGELPRDALAQRGNLTPQARGTLQLKRATALLKTLTKRLDATPAASRPPVAIVLLGPMLWARLEQRGGSVQAQVHASGPDPGDVVLVTDTPAIEAIATARMSFEQAIELGFVRLYGPQKQVGALQSWLVSSAHP